MAFNDTVGRGEIRGRLVRKLWRLLVDRPYRHSRWLDLTRPEGLFQPSIDTGTDRYPYIFGFVQSELGGASDIEILSFGCSTGEEVFSLRRYFPRARIKGIDINPGNISVCRRRLRRHPDAGIAFATANSTTSEATSSFDVIFALAVLRHGGLAAPGVMRCDHLIRFEDFAALVADFRRCLKPGGLLVIRHSNFRLCDTEVADAFETIMSVPRPENARASPIFGPDNRLLPGVDYLDTVFRKRSA